MTELVSDLFTSGRVVDFILLVVVVEVIVLAVFPRLRGAMSLTDVALLIAPGVIPYDNGGRIGRRFRIPSLGYYPPAPGRGVRSSLTERRRHYP